MSLGAFVAGIGYLVLYPGFGAYSGLLDWTSRGQLEKEQQVSQALLAPLMETVQNSTPTALAKNPDAVQLGGRLFEDNCAACHDSSGLGNKVIGAPNLLDNAWIYGGDDKTILASIEQGREGVMPPWAHLGYGRVKNLAHYVRSLSGASHDASAARAGKEDFPTCAACHSADGTGNPAMGAPNLTDDAWLYGGELDQVITSISQGRHGQMPPWEDRLDADQMKLITAWIVANGQTSTP